MSTHSTMLRLSTQSIDGPVTLAELEQRADEHTEVCR